MRVTAFILAVFIGFLSLQPCGDVDTHAKDEKTMQVEHTHSHSSDADDSCTSFCICACCGIPMELKSIYIFAHTKEIDTYIIHAYGYKSTYRSYFSNTIWEPPIV